MYNLQQFAIENNFQKPGLYSTIGPRKMAAWHS